jgi:hypothetical protein
MKYIIDECHFETKGPSGQEYLDVKLHPEGYVTLQIGDNDTFTIYSESEIHFIHDKILEALRQVKTNKKNEKKL